MEYVVQAIKVSENVVLAKANGRTLKTGFYVVFLKCPCRFWRFDVFGTF